MNKEHTKKAITARFLLICEEVMKEGVCKTKKEFAAAVGEHAQNFTLMEKGQRAPTLEHIAKACDHYGYSPTWVILGRGAHKLVAEKDPLEDRMDRMEDELETLKRHLVKKIVTGT